MQLTGLAKQHYTDLGRLVAKRHPDLAKDLLAQIVYPDPVETDYSRIPEYFSQFCQIQQIDPEQYRHSMHKKRKKLSAHRLFIGVMIHLYCPHIRQINRSDLYIKPGFAKFLGIALNQKLSNISNMIRQVLEWETVYDDFREDIQKHVSAILNAQNQ